MFFNTEHTYYSTANLIYFILMGFKYGTCLISILSIRRQQKCFMFTAKIMLLHEPRCVLRNNGAIKNCPSRSYTEQRITFAHVQLAVH